MNEQELCFSTMRSEAFVLVNKKILKELGGKSALFLSILITKDHYLTEHKLLTEDGFFYVTIESMENETSLTRREQDPIIESLQEKNLLSVSLKGLPARRHFKIHYDKVLQILYKQDCAESTNCEVPDTSVKSSDSTVCTKSTNLLVQNVQQIKTDNKNKSTDYAPQRMPPASIKRTININRNGVPLVEKDIPLHPDKKPRMPSRFVFKPVKKSDDIQDIIDYWESKGLSAHKEGTKNEAKAVHFIEAILDGSLFKGFKDEGYDRKYSVKEIKKSIDNFALIALNEDYMPMNKDYLRSIAFFEFFYNSRRSGEAIDKSSFLKNLFTAPVPKSDSKIFALKDEHPNVTAILINWYKQKFGQINKLTIRQRNEIVFAGRNLKEFYEYNKVRLKINSEWKRIYGQQDDLAFLAVQLTRTFDKILRENEGLYVAFNTKWFKNETTMLERLPKFLIQENMMK